MEFVFVFDFVEEFIVGLIVVLNSFVNVMGYSRLRLVFFFSVMNSEYSEIRIGWSWLMLISLENAAHCRLLHVFEFWILLSKSCVKIICNF